MMNEHQHYTTSQFHASSFRERGLVGPAPRVLRGARSFLPFSSGLAAIVIGAVAGCGEARTAHFGPRNYRLVQALRTAVSARKTDWLDQTVKLIDHRHETGELADEEFAALDSVVTQARQGDWTQAESDLMKLIKAQRATAVEIEEMKATHHRAKKSAQSEE